MPLRNYSLTHFCFIIKNYIYDVVHFILFNFFVDVGLLLTFMLCIGKRLNKLLWECIFCPVDFQFTRNSFPLSTSSQR